MGKEQWRAYLSGNVFSAIIGRRRQITVAADDAEYVTQADKE